MFDQHFAPTAGLVAGQDCPVTGDTYIPLGHVAPNGREFVMDFQDMRMYPGVAISDAEIRSVGTDGVVTRACGLPQVGGGSVPRPFH